MLKLVTLIVATAVLSGCASIVPGSEQAAAEARKHAPVANKTSIYFCREWAYAGGGIALYPLINGNTVATMPTKTFTRVDLPPGKYEVALGYYDKSDSGLFRALQRDPVKMEDINAKAGEVRYYWLGMAGSSVFGGSLTIDHFDSAAQARQCVEDSTYVSPR